MYPLRRAMTLFEIAVTLGLAAFAFITVIALIPVGLRQQEQARFQLFASAKVLDMMEAFNTIPAMDRDATVQANQPWDVPLANRISDHDIEIKLASTGFGLLPLPTTIARRLESDNDEIQKLLAEGGNLYYASGLPSVPARDEQINPGPRNELRRLIIGIGGYAQQNSIGVNPWRPWPMYAVCPSPPYSQQDDGTARAWYWERTDPDLRLVNSTELLEPAPAPVQRNGSNFGTDYQAGAMWYGKVNAYGNSYSDPDPERARRYFALARWYALTKGMPATWTDGGRATLADIESAAAQPHWTIAARVLAHAAMTLSRHYTALELQSGPDFALIPVYHFRSSGDPLALAEFNVSLAHLVNYHENAMDLTMHVQATRPYDWAMPRPFNRAIMMDVPLLQWDLYDPAPLTGTISGSTVAAEHWRMISPQPVVNGDTDTWRIPATAWGDQSRFNLTEAFDPSERCRQIVVWAVDWQSYEDFESAPAPAIDASRYPLKLSGTFDQRMVWASSSSNADADRDHSWLSFRNPEKQLAFVRPPPALDPGGSVWEDRLIQGGDNQWKGSFPIYPDCGPGPSPDPSVVFDPRGVFLGLYGADRNANIAYDRGTIPTSVRLRAALVARYNVYDPRLPMVLR